MLHSLGQQQKQDRCILREDKPECFLELATTNDGAYVTLNSNAKTASEVCTQQLHTGLTTMSSKGMLSSGQTLVTYVPLQWAVCT